VNYYQARQRESDKRWDWTCKNDDQVWAMPPCSGHKDGHETAEQAVLHFFSYEAEHLTEHEIAADTQHRCEWVSTVDNQRCPNWTTKWLEARHWGGHQFLCDEHRIPTNWAYLNRPGEDAGDYQIISSY